MEKCKDKKKLKKIIVSAVAVALAIVLLVLCIFGEKIIWNSKRFIEKSQTADLKISIDADKKYETFDGWGSSACWWAQIAGDNENAEKIISLLYGDDGLGLNIYRYNIGAGSADNPNTKISDPWRRTESFYYYNKESGEYEYDFSRDANAKKMLDLAISYGNIDTVVLFANSAHFSMTKNGLASGNEEWWVSNLAPNQYDAYAEYLMTITEYFIKEKGLTDKGITVCVSPINEPNWSWGVKDVNQGQEGCFYNSEDIYNIYKACVKKIKEKNLPVKLSGPEAAEIGHRLYEWFEYMYNDSEIKPYLSTLSYHSYWSDDSVENKVGLGKWLDKNMPDMKIEMSEWCHLPCTSPIDSIDGALLQARVISNDLEFSHANSWTAWVGVNGIGIGEDGKQYSDGLLAASDAEISDIIIPMRYYAMAHYTKFIPKGSVRISTEKNINDILETTENDTVYSKYITNAVTYLTPEGKIVCVTVNEGVGRKLDFKVDAEKMTVYTTTQDYQLKNTYTGEIDTINLPEKSIVTVVFE